MWPAWFEVAITKMLKLGDRAVSAYERSVELRAIALEFEINQREPDVEDSQIFAEKVKAQSTTATKRNNEVYSVGTYGKIIEGTHKGRFCIIESTPEEPGYYVVTVFVNFATNLSANVHYLHFEAVPEEQVKAWREGREYNPD